MLVERVGFWKEPSVIYLITIMYPIEKHFLIVIIFESASPFFYSSPFDLSGCDDSDQHLSISTGFRTGQNPANKNKLEIWIVPQFVLQKDLRAKPYNEFLQKQDGHRNKPFAILFNWGGWIGEDYAHGVTGDDGNEFDHLVSAWSAAAWHTARATHARGPAVVDGTIGKFLYINE